MRRAEVAMTQGEARSVAGTSLQRDRIARPRTSQPSSRSQSATTRFELWNRV